MVIAHPMLPAHASTSSTNRNGHALKSSLIQLTMPNMIDVKVFCPLFPEWCLVRRDPDWFRPALPCAQS
jgi:hypothetical protein